MPDPHIRSRIKENKKKTRYCKITGSKPPLDFQRSAHCTGRCTALVPFVSSMASIFRVGYEARYTVSHSSFRSVLPGKCSIIRKITRDVEEKGAREICSQIPHWPQRFSRVIRVFYPQWRNRFVVARHPFEDWDPEFLVSSSAVRIYLCWMKIYSLLLYNIYI